MYIFTKKYVNIRSIKVNKGWQKLDNNLSYYLEEAFEAMNICYKVTKSNKQIIYNVNFPEKDSFSETVNLVIDEMFSAEIFSYIARGITETKRHAVLESINQINDRFLFINSGIDENNDVYSCQQFILAGSQKIMCKQIITNIVVFYDLYKRTSQKIQSIINSP